MAAPLTCCREGPIAVNDCVDGAQDPCMVSNCCFMSRNWNRVNLAVRNALIDVSLEDLIDPAQLFAPAYGERAENHHTHMRTQKKTLCKRGERDFFRAVSGS